MHRKNLQEALSANEKRNIGLYLTQAQFVEGILLDVQSNHVVLEVDKNIIYIAMQQIRTLSKNTKDFRIARESTPHLVRDKWNDVLGALRYHWVTINRYSNPTLSGILSSISVDYIILINNEELFYIPTSHITDISKDKRLIAKQDRDRLGNIGFMTDIADSINKGKVGQNSFISLLTELANTLVSEKAVVAPNGNFHTKLQEPIYTHTDALEALEENKLEIINEDLVASPVDNRLSIKNDVHTDINTDKLEGDAPSEEKLENEQHYSYSDELNVSLNRTKSKEKDVLLKAWSTMNSDQSTIALPKKKHTQTKNTTPTPFENTIMTNLHNGIVEQSSLSEKLDEGLELQEKLDLSKVSDIVGKKKTLLTANVRTKKEINEMLEQQYFALMNYAAVQISNTVNVEHVDNKLHFHPSVEGGPEKVRRCEIISGYSFYDSKQDTSALEKQYTSLMRHATKMYRKLRK